MKSKAFRKFLQYSCKAATWTVLLPLSIGFYTIYFAYSMTVLSLDIGYWIINCADHGPLVANARWLKRTIGPIRFDGDKII